MQGWFNSYESINVTYYVNRRIKTMWSSQQTENASDKNQHPIIINCQPTRNGRKRLQTDKRNLGKNQYHTNGERKNIPHKVRSKLSMFTLIVSIWHWVGQSSSCNTQTRYSRPAIQKWISKTIFTWRQYDLVCKKSISQ